MQVPNLVTANIVCIETFAWEERDAGESYDYLGLFYLLRRDQI